MELTEEEIEMMDMALSRMRAYQKASQMIITEHLARNGKGNIESRIRIVSLLFSYELVKGTTPLFYITDKGIRAQRTGVEEYMRAVEKKEMEKEVRGERLYLISLATLAVSVTGILVTVLIALTQAAR